MSKLSPPLHKAKKIAMVGALTENGSLSYYDREYLAISIKLSKKFGIIVSENPDIQVFNIDPNQDGRDFLDINRNNQADIVVLCHIFRATHANIERIKAHKKVCPAPDLFLYSQYTLTQGAWMEATLRSKAKLIVAIANKNEIGPDDFTGGAFKALNHNEKLEPRSMGLPDGRAMLIDAPKIHAMSVDANAACTL